MWPSLEIWCAPSAANGLITADTWGSGAAWPPSAVRAWWRGRRTAPVVTDHHLGRTAGLVREVAVQDLLGRLGTAGQVVGEVAAGGLGHDVDGHQATSQAIRTHQRWSWHQPASRARALSSAGLDVGRSPRTRSSSLLDVVVIQGLSEGIRRPDLD